MSRAQKSWTWLGGVLVTLFGILGGWAAKAWTAAEQSGKDQAAVVTHAEGDARYVLRAEFAPLKQSVDNTATKVDGMSSTLSELVGELRAERRVRP